LEESFENSQAENYQRWYDQDPALSRALAHLRSASDKHQAQVALNIIKIIVEHQMEDSAQLPSSITELDGKQLLEGLRIQMDPLQRRRWYDANETLRSAMQLLRDCPEDLQQTIIPTIVRMIERTLQDCYQV
jgi:hypothetical protein